MSDGFKNYDRDQLMLFPPNLGDWIPRNDFSWYVVDVISQLNMETFFTSYRPGTGRKAYPPEVLLATLVYAYSRGIQSSRKIEELCLSDLRVRFVSANLLPDHSTICRFRNQHETEISSIFKQTLFLAAEAGMKRLGTISLDGTKMKGNASLGSNKTLESLKKEVDRIMKEAAETDKSENELYGKDKRGDELPDDMIDPNSRLRRIESCIERLASKEKTAKQEQADLIRKRKEEEASTGKKKRGRKPKLPEEVVDKECKANTTDPESRIMKTRTGYIQGYNAQAVVSEDQLIIAAEITQDENDIQQLRPMIEKAFENTESIEAFEKIESLLGDTGYWNEEQIAHFKGTLELYIATKKDRMQREEIRTISSPRGRTPQNFTEKEKMERKLLTKKGKEKYKQRGWMSEGVFGQIKHALGIDSFFRRGIRACQSEWKLICSAHNLLKIHKITMRT